LLLHRLASSPSPSLTKWRCHLSVLRRGRTPSDSKTRWGHRRQTSRSIRRRTPPKPSVRRGPRCRRRAASRRLLDDVGEEPLELRGRRSLSEVADRPPVRPEHEDLCPMRDLVVPLGHLRWFDPDTVLFRGLDDLADRRAGSDEVRVETTEPRAHLTHGVAPWIGGDEANRDVVGHVR